MSTEKSPKSAERHWYEANCNGRREDIVTRASLTLTPLISLAFLLSGMANPALGTLELGVVTGVAAKGEFSTRRKAAREEAVRVAVETGASNYRHNEGHFWTRRNLYRSA